MRRCLEPSCDRLTERTRCTECQAQRESERNAARPWYRDTRYRLVRAHLNKTGAVCWRCGAWCPPGSVTVDHDPQVSSVEDWRTCELRPACAACNYSANERPSATGR
jgi:hypothetical protein